MENQARMIPRHLKFSLLVAVMASGCVEEPPPRSVSEFMEDGSLLEAALVRCTSDPAGSRYDPECVNANEAVKRIEAKEEEARRAELEALSQRKREALRRTQQAAAEARRWAAERERLRKEAEYQAQFGLPMPRDSANDEVMAGNEPQAVIPAPSADSTPADAPGSTTERFAPPLPAAGSNAPAIEVAPPEPATSPADLGSIREELQRRNEEKSDE